MATTVGAFNHSASLFAQAYGDGRVKVFDTATGKALQDLLPTAHLRTTVCSLAWNQPRSSKLKAQTVALGCDNGAVDLFSLGSGECISSLEGSGKSPALCAAFAPAGDSVWIGYGSGLVLQFDLATGERLNKLKVSSSGVRSLALDGSKACEWLATGCATGLQVWDLESLQPRALSGHQGAVTLLKSSPDGSYMLSGSQEGADRTISLWEPKGETKAPVRSFSLTSVPTQLVFGASEGHVLFGAVAQGGGCSLWVLQEGSRPKKAPRLSLNSQSGLLAVHCAPEGLLACLGSVASPEFQPVAVCGDEAELLKGDLVIDTKHAAALQQEGRAPVLNRSAAKQASGHADDAVAVVGAGVLASPARRQRAATLGERAAGEALETENVRAAPKADSSAVLLTQALHKEDAALLEDCLSCRDPSLISNTVKRLPVTSLVPFLEQVLVRVKTRPNRAKLLAHWIRAAITEHSSFLGTVPGAAAVIAEFFELLDQRLTVMPHLLQLQGRLQLITSQIARASAGRSKQAVSAAITFNEPSREEEDGEEDEEEEGSEEDMEEDSEEGSEEDEMEQDSEAEEGSDDDL